MDINKMSDNIAKNINCNNKLMNTIIPHLLNKVCSSYLSLFSLEKKGARVSELEIKRAMESVEGIFNSSKYTDKLFELTQSNHPNSREILYVGSLFYSYKGDTNNAVKYYSALADYYKKLDKTVEYKKYSEIVDKLLSKK